MQTSKCCATAQRSCFSEQCALLPAETVWVGEFTGTPVVLCRSYCLWCCHACQRGWSRYLLSAHNKRTLKLNRQLYIYIYTYISFRTGPEMKQVWKPSKPDVGESKGRHPVADAHVHICSTSSSAGFVLILSKLNWLGFLEASLRFARYILFSSWCLATWWSTWGAPLATRHPGSSRFQVGLKFPAFNCREYMVVLFLQQNAATFERISIWLKQCDSHLSQH